MRRPHALVMASFFTATTAFLASLTSTVEGQSVAATEAPAAFDNKTNGYLSQADFDAFRAAFEQREEIPDGLGPVYNAQSCAECHQNPVTGATSQISELRAGHRDALGHFVDAP